jgi:hypothetical protein
MDVRVYARLEWIRLYKPIYGKFDKESALHIELLKQTFWDLGYNPNIDTWLRDWKPTPPAGAGGNTASGAPGAPTRSAVPAH